MSPQLISRSLDLQRLREEGYEIEIRGGFVLAKNIPYVNERREVCIGTLVSELTLAGDVAAPPGNHVIYFAGAVPCTKDGTALSQIVNASGEIELSGEIRVQHTFSSRPPNGYRDYYDKFVTYINILGSHAASLDPNATARTFIAVDPDDDSTVFNYRDTATTRGGTWKASRKLAGQKIAIIGVGGTGSYVLDLVSKTPVAEIHLFDGDEFLQHNAFRAPGAASLEVLKGRPKKADHFAQVYGHMHRSIISYPYNIDESTVADLDHVSFAFICIDSGTAKKLVIDRLESAGVAFIDVGMGIQLVNDELVGILRVTSSTPTMRDHIRDKRRISLADGNDNAYGSNIQIADLNALNASLAVIKWKKLSGFYQDQEQEHHSTYSINVNMLTSDDQPCLA
jgi:hypothetical protein